MKAEREGSGGFLRRTKNEFLGKGVSNEGRSVDPRIPCGDYGVRC